MVEMHVFGLAVDEDTQVPVLILKDKDDQRALPIWIGAMEALAISMTLHNVSLPRPMTHDLLLKTIETVGAKVDSVAITELRDGTYYAEIRLLMHEEMQTVDSRPSDAIALALRAQAAIYVNDDVLEQAAVTEKEASQPLLHSDDAEEWTEILEKFTLDDTKYKM
ncbi:bifunctional nuclease family protein [Desulfovibrio inopinatus]|uniref:bifunctional nuclease family protein n=1 Tax=Desulfovibrio inopinatus TaxID=102109 RepID=UPI0003F7C28B|nr:bifunctional nuclease family protein [Desulfovibrio inopinatus]